MVAPLITIGTSILGIKDSPWWERAIFFGACIAIVGEFVQRISQQGRMIEPAAVRRRCRSVFDSLARDVLPSDKSIQITLFVPDRPDGSPVLVPIVRYSASAPEGHEPATKARFSTSSSKLINEAWLGPNTPRVVVLPAHTSMTDARAWHQYNLNMPATDTEMLSERTLLAVRCICNVALGVPFLPNRSIALVSITSEREGDFMTGLSEATKGVLAKHLQTIALMVAPLGV